MTDKIANRTQKLCPRCKEIKSLELFARNKARHDGREGYCKPCSSYLKKQSQKKNPDCSKKRTEYRKRWQEKNKEKYLQIHKNYREKNKDKIAEKRKTEERKKYNREYMRDRRKDPIEHVRHNVSRQVVHGLKRAFGSKHGQPVFDKVGYSPEQLKEHLEKQFDANMNWDNYGTYWHIDHIVPHSHFEYDSLDSPEFKKCWALENLRPLEAIENIRKGNKLID